MTEHANSDAANPRDGKYISWTALHQRERKLLGLEARERSACICLSGGGVRSAVTCMGILTSLSKRGILKHFHYLSTVSGGGYAGGAMTHWVNERAADTKNESTPPGMYDLPFVTQKDQSAKEPSEAEWKKIEGNHAYIRHLRANISYLMPNGILGLLRGIYVFTRAVSLNLFVWVTMLAAIFYGLLVVGNPDERAHQEQKLFHCGASIEGIADKTPEFFNMISGPLNGVLTYGTPASLCEKRLIAPNVIISDNDAETESLAATDPNGQTSGSAEKTVLVPVTSWGHTIFAWSLAVAAFIALLLPIRMIWYSVWTFAKASRYVSLSDTDDHSQQKVVKSVAESRYRYRQRHEKVSELLFGAFLGFLVFGLIPVVTFNLPEIFDFLNGKGGPNTSGQNGYFVGTISLLFGIATSTFVTVRDKLGKVIGTKTAILVVLGGALFVSGVIILAFNLAYAVHVQSYNYWIVAGILVLALVLAVACSINEVSLGRFYRDRLIETFMPDSEIAFNDKLASTGQLAVTANALRFKELVKMGKDESDEPFEYVNRPLHIVNTNVVSWWSNDTRAKRRRGDNFVLSAAGGGSDTTKWREIDNIAAGKMTLATAISASGAAANPSAGFAGGGPTTTFPVALSMSLLNIRLGYWLRWQNEWSSNPFGNRINPSLFHFFGRLLSRSNWVGDQFARIYGSKENLDINDLSKATNVTGPAKEGETSTTLERLIGNWLKNKGRAPNFVELTDGGHFENLGIYELIRRRCKLIIVCDAEPDAKTSYASFTSAIRRVREDFGTIIKFDMQRDSTPTDDSKNNFVDSGPQDLVARNDDNQYPSGALYSKKGFFLASITYPPNNQEDDLNAEHKDGYRASATSNVEEEGMIIYLKSALISDLELTTKGYRGANERFPNDPTSNQFFSPEQFEAYRDMGEKIAEQMIEDLKLIDPKIGRLLSIEELGLQEMLRSLAYESRSKLADGEVMP